MAEKSVRLGCWAAFWGDTSVAVDQILDGAQVDYLVSDTRLQIKLASALKSGGKTRLRIKYHFTIPGLFGSSPFDDEGVPSRRTVVIERGVGRGRNDVVFDEQR